MNLRKERSGTWKTFDYQQRALKLIARNQEASCLSSFLASSPRGGEGGWKGIEHTEKPPQDLPARKRRRKETYFPRPTYDYTQTYCWNMYEKVEKQRQKLLFSVDKAMMMMVMTKGVLGLGGWICRPKRTRRLRGAACIQSFARKSHKFGGLSSPQEEKRRD